jgi:hypothetical protein
MRQITVVTARFNNDTLAANYAYRDSHKYKSLYCSPCELSPKIEHNSHVFVIEMNNSTNEVVGIGIIRNKPALNRYYKVHEHGNMNRYIYIGDYYMSRSLMIEYNSRLIYLLDECLFKGKSHSKRGDGLTLFPEKIYQKYVSHEFDIKKEIKTVFVRHFREKTE